MLMTPKPLGPIMRMLMLPELLPHLVFQFAAFPPQFRETAGLHHHPFYSQAAAVS